MVGPDRHASQIITHRLTVIRQEYTAAGHMNTFTNGGTKSCRAEVKALLDGADQIYRILIVHNDKNGTITGVPNGDRNNIGLCLPEMRQTLAYTSLSGIERGESGFMKIILGPSHQIFLSKNVKISMQDYTEKPPNDQHRQWFHGHKL
jgi:hypothetical protein